MEPCRILIVGNAADMHVAAVLARLPRLGTVILDADTLAETVDEIGIDYSIFTDIDGNAVRLSHETKARGWIRRLAPAGWDSAVVLGSQHAARLAARLSLLSAILRDLAVEWLTPIDRLTAAENKMIQYRAAKRLSIRFPATLIAKDPFTLARALAEPFVLKPLGPAEFQSETGEHRVTLTNSVRARDISDIDLLIAPFIAQRQLDAVAHLRIVTVGTTSWTARLDASDLPLDWRSQPAAHDQFYTDTTRSDLSRPAVAIARLLGVGYTSQDWLIDSVGPAFLDLNPSGQWLFLPEAIADEVTEAIIGWLCVRGAS